MASSYGSLLDVRDKNNDTSKVMNISNVPATWEARLLKDIDEFRNVDPNCRICRALHSSKQAMHINDDLIPRYPELNIKILAGSDSGMTKKA